MSRGLLSQLSPAELDTFLDQPALTPPNGVIPQFQNRPNKNALCITVESICFTATTIAVLVRAYTVVFKEKKVKLEDILAFVGYAAYVTYVSVCYREAVENGEFIHQWDVQFRQLPKILYDILVVTNAYAVTLMAIKVAILREWVRIFVPPGTRNFFFWMSYGAMLFNTLYYVSGIISTNLACIPHRAIWEITIPARCINSKAIVLAGAIINLISDVIILLLPQKTIWSLNMPTRKKSGVSIIFAFGIFGCVAAACRLAASITYVKSEDQFYTSAPLSLWAIAEMTSAFLVFCVPSFPKAFSGPGIVSRLASSMRSWTRISAKSSNVQLGTPWKRHNVNRTDSNDSSNKIVDDDIHLQSMVSSRFIAPKSRNLRDGATSDRGVLCTTDFMTTEDMIDGNNVTGEDEYRKQHPWVNS